MKHDATTFTRYDLEPIAASGPIPLADFKTSPKLSEMRVTYKRRIPPEDRYAIRFADHAVAYLRRIWDKRTIELIEDFVVLYLDNSHHVLGWVKVASGGLSSCTVDPRVVFGIALQTAASAILVAHNHPSDGTEPSDADKAITNTLRGAGKLLGVTFLDHIILTRYQAFSFKEHDLL